MRGIIVLTIFLLTLVLTGCKTSEANYRAAYEKAKTRGESEAVDREVYDKIAQEQGPSPMTFGSVTIPGKKMYMSVMPTEDVAPGTVRSFSVVAARFKQLFNARSVAKRLKEMGFNDAFITKDREDYYYAVASSVGSALEALDVMNRLKESGLAMPETFPYVIVIPGTK